MSVTLHFDPAGNLESPTLVLCRQNCTPIMPIINQTEFVFSDSLSNPSEISFRVYKNSCTAWKSIKDFRVVWIPEWNKYYKIQVDLTESNSTTKFISGTHLPEAELSQLNVYELEINTERDIDNRIENQPSTILYNKNIPAASLLHRILSKAVNYNIGHVDDRIAKIQRTFSFNGTSVYDCLLEVATEINCHFEFEARFNKETKKVERIVSVYDLESQCRICGHRGEFHFECSECGSTNIDHGYGEDTTIFFSTDNVSDEINYSTNVDAVKNCFRLETNDEILDDVIKACNPNGTKDIWYIERNEDMSKELINALDEYDAIYDKYNKSYIYNINAESFNKIAEKYLELVPEREEVIPVAIPVVGYQNLINSHYNAIDLQTFLESVLMPTIDIAINTTAIEQEEMLRNNIKSVAIQTDDLSSLNVATVDSAVLSMAEAIVDSRYKVKLSTDTSYSNNIWVGQFIITNYSAETDTYTTPTDKKISITITDNYEQFLEEKIDKVLAKGDNTNYGIASLYDLSVEDFINRLQYYGVAPLETIKACGESVLAILTDQGIPAVPMDESRKDLYEGIFVPYWDKTQEVIKALNERNNEILTIEDFIETITQQEAFVHEELNFEKKLGSDLWKELNVYRREDVYTNSTYIFDGLSNAELMSNVNMYVQDAMKEIVKSATLQHTLSSTLKNLFATKEFAPLREHFSVGNWLRVGVDDEVYKLRLLEYEIDFENYESTPVEFSDVITIGDDITDIQSVIDNARSMSTSYSSVERQAAQGSDTYNVVNGWSTRGLDATLTKIMNDANNINTVFDSNGLLFRRQNEFGDTYEDEQLRIINSTLAVTDDNWKTIKTAIGKFYYEDPASPGTLKQGYGINGDLLVGRLILGEELGIYNEGATLKFTENGLVITNGTNTFTVNPNADSVFTISNSTENVIYFDSNGNAHFKGHIDATSLTLSGDSKLSSSDISGMDNYIQKDQTISMNGSSFKVSSAGLLTAENAVIKGTIYAMTGEIGNLTLQNGSLYNGTSSITSTTAGIYLGSDGFRQYSSANAYVNIQNGKITAYGANINGTITTSNITATGGTIGGWIIKDTHIYNGKEYYGTFSNSSTGIGTYPETNLAFWAGDGTFKVDMDGTVFSNTFMSGNDTNSIQITAGTLMSSATNTGNIVHTILTENGVFVNKISATSKEDTLAQANYYANRIKMTSYLWTIVDIQDLPNTDNNIRFQGRFAFYDESVTMPTIYLQGSIDDQSRPVLNSEATLERDGYTSVSHVGMTSKGGFCLLGDASSIRYKNTIQDLSLDFVKDLYTLPLHTFIYNDDYLNDFDERYHKTIPGFIAEELNEIMPIAVDHNEDGSVEKWNDKIIIPCLLKLIQNNHEEIQELKEQIRQLLSA